MPYARCGRRAAGVSCAPQELANTLWAAAWLEALPPEPWLAAFWASATPRLAQFDPRGLRALLQAADMLQLQPPWPRSRRRREELEQLAHRDEDSPHSPDRDGGGGPQRVGKRGPS